MVTSLLRKGGAALALAALFASTGCIEFERSITLNKDLSGKARFQMSMNIESMARMMAQMTREMSGATGAPTEAEISSAITEMKAQMANEPPPDKTAMAASLPAGFTLDDLVQKLEGSKMSIAVTLGFSDVRKLPALKLNDPSPKPGAAGADNAMQPFEGLEIKDEGQTLLITAKLLTTGDAKIKPAGPPQPGSTDPVAAQGVTDALNEMMKEMGGAEGMKTMLESVMKDMKESFRVQTPMTIVDTNATRREAGAVVWEQTMESLIKAQATAAGKPMTMSVRVRK